MPWPGITDYSEAVQNPRLCFRGTDLETGQVSLNQRGMPLVFSGAFACVYPVSVANRTFAVRCFTREVSDQRSRYGELSSYLLNVLPPSFVHFEYVERGISLRGDWYPIVRMEWVDGQLLSRFVESRLNQPETLRRVAAQWRGGPTASLRGLRIAHNDLQHGNVMVQKDGSIRLVDYDGMYLPKFRGERSPELGHKNYQHPERSSEHFDENVDNFPSLVIYLSLLAVASDPSLWDFHDEDNLIFTRKDYADPRGSEVFGRLKRSHDQAVAKLAERLEEYCALSAEKVPDLEAVLQDIPPSAVVPSPAAPSTAAPQASTRSTASAPAGSSYRQTLRAHQPTPVPPTPPPTGQPPIAPRTARPASTIQSTGVPTAPSGHHRRCPTCNAANSPAAVACVKCGTAMAASVPRPNLPVSPPNPPAPTVSMEDFLDSLRGASLHLRLALKRAAASGELARVVAGVVAIVLAVIAGVLALIVWAFSQRGWYL